MSIKRGVLLIATTLVVAGVVPSSAVALSAGTQGSASWEGNFGVGATLTTPRVLATSAVADSTNGTVPVHFRGYVNPPCGDVFGVLIDETVDASVSTTPTHMTVSGGPGIIFHCPDGWAGAGDYVFPFHLDADLVAPNLTYVSATEARATGSGNSTINIVMGTNDPRYNYRVATTTYQPYLDLGTSIDTQW